MAYSIAFVFVLRKFLPSLIFGRLGRNILISGVSEIDRRSESKNCLKKSIYCFGI